MALPRVNDTPKYELVIPSTKQTIKFRPFLVKEQKILLIAMETQDQLQILNAIMDTIQSCVLSDIKMSALTSFDVEYIFIQLRAKSVGETSKVSILCAECDASNPVDINLDNARVKLSEVSPFVKVNDKYTIKLRWPNYKYMINNKLNTKDQSPTESMYEYVVGCLDSLQSEDDNISFDDESRQEVNTFLESLTSSQFEEIINFVQNIPQLTYNVEFDCSCGHHNKITLQGIDDFF